MIKKIEKQPSLKLKSAKNEKEVGDRGEACKFSTQNAWSNLAFWEGLRQEPGHRIADDSPAQGPERHKQRNIQLI